MKYTPDKWVIVEVTNEGKIHYRIFGTWLGGYLNGQSWRMNSGNTEVHKTKEGAYNVFGNSGSCYFLNPLAYGVGGYTGSVLKEFVDNSDGGIKIFSEEQSLRYLEDASKE